MVNYLLWVHVQERVKVLEHAVINETSDRRVSEVGQPIDQVNCVQYLLVFNDHYLLEFDHILEEATVVQGGGLWRLDLPYVFKSPGVLSIHIVVYDFRVI